jgi:hypothetical protein
MDPNARQRERLSVELERCEARALAHGAEMLMDIVGGPQKAPTLACAYARLECALEEQWASALGEGRL